MTRIVLKSGPPQVELIDVEEGEFGGGSWGTVVNDRLLMSVMVVIVVLLELLKALSGSLVVLSWAVDAQKKENKKGKGSSKGVKVRSGCVGAACSLA